VKCSSIRIIVCVLLLAQMVSACSPSPSAPAMQTSTARSPLFGAYVSTPFAASAHSGTIVYAGMQFPASVNPLFAGSDSDFAVRDALWASPVFYDQSFHVHPDQLSEVPLPENGDVRDDGKTIIMRLRHDLRWSDGQPILASDFRYWWQLDQNPDTGALITGGYDQIASIDTPDQYTVVLHMKRPSGSYLFYLPYAAPQHAWGKIAPIQLQNMASIYSAPQITDGPYKLASYVDGQSYTMIPNPYYHSSTFHGPFLARLIYRAYSDLPALAAAVRQQQVNLSQGYMEYQLPALASLPASVHVLETPAAAYEHLDFNNGEPLLQDVRVRRAIALAINVCGLIQSVLHAPNCARRATQVEPPPSLFYDSTIQPLPYDPASARNLLAQAGWSLNGQGLLTRNGQLFSLRLVTTADNPLRAAAAAYIQRALRAVGIQVQVAFYSLNQFFGLYTQGGILATGKFDLALFAYADSPEPDDEYNTFSSSQIPTASNPDLGNYARVNDPIIDQALAQGRDSVVFADRQRAYHRFLERLASQLYILPLYTGLNIMTVDKSVQNIIPSADLSASDWNIADWWRAD
jgi:peptide/nickel transport system substrate-binding protein